MGSQIDPSMTFANLPAKETRDLLRRAYNISFSKAWLIERGFNPPRSEKLIRALKASGFIDEDKRCRSSGDKTIWFTLTEKGRSFARSSAAKRVTQIHAKKSLEDLIARAIELNLDERFLSRVTELVVFGSFLSESETLGDIDLAYATASRVVYPDSDSYYRACEESFYANGRTSKTILDISVWPDEQIRLHLKNRQRVLSLHQMGEFVRLQAGKQSPYRVLIGDPDQILERIRNQKTPEASE